MKEHQLIYFMICWGFHVPLIGNPHGPEGHHPSIFLTAQFSAEQHLTESPVSARDICELIGNLDIHA